MPELSIGLSKTAQAVRGLSPGWTLTWDANTPPIRALRPTGHSESGSE